eukprot:TRINITY_DN4148_c0_g1_i2.p2 TRINITY_DN4148_c0_g1~~TRINITY_DN4148_c0_g1_i2.p2  ORF type:complete len:211 (-),score=-9.30 TRINITY_DN4148_c0_g1_i2:125-757(-)
MIKKKKKKKKTFDYTLKQYFSIYFNNGKKPIVFLTTYLKLQKTNSFTKQKTYQTLYLYKLEILQSTFPDPNPPQSELTFFRILASVREFLIFAPNIFNPDILVRIREQDLTDPNFLVRITSNKFFVRFKSKFPLKVLIRTKNFRFREIVISNPNLKNSNQQSELILQPKPILKSLFRSGSDFGFGQGIFNLCSEYFQSGYFSSDQRIRFN